MAMLGGTPLARGGACSYLSLLPVLLLIMGGAAQLYGSAAASADQDVGTQALEQGDNITELPMLLKFEIDFVSRVAIAMGERPSNRELAKRIEAAMLLRYPTKVYDVYLNLYLTDVGAFPTTAVLLHGLAIPPECTHSPETLSDACLDAGGALTGTAVVLGVEKSYVLIWTRTTAVDFESKKAYPWIQESVKACMKASRLTQILQNKYPALDVSVKRRFGKAVTGCVSSFLTRHYFPPRVVAVLPGEKRGFALQGLLYSEYLEPRLYSIIPRKFTPGGLIAVLP